LRKKGKSKIKIPNHKQQIPNKIPYSNSNDPNEDISRWCGFIFPLLKQITCTKSYYRKVLVIGLGLVKKRIACNPRDVVGDPQGITVTTRSFRFFN